MPMKALKAAISKVLNASWQRCRVHFMRNVLAYMNFPAAHRTKLLSTNPIEWLNGEIKRRTEVVDSPQRSRHHALGRSDPARTER